MPVKKGDEELVDRRQKKGMTWKVAEEKGIIDRLARSISGPANTH